MQHVMIDLETLGTGPNAVIVQIGAVFFNELMYPNRYTSSASDLSKHPLDLECLGHTFSESIDMRDAANYGKMDADTVAWWMSQSDVARNKVLGGTEKLKDALDHFRAFMGTATVADVRVWGNGPSFDMVILKSAFDAAGISAPWKFYNERCVRTVKEVGAAIGVNMDSIPPVGIHHNALDDALFQAHYVCKVLSTVRALRPEADDNDALLDAAIPGLQADVDPLS